ncbi:MAG: hypothetical protein GX358_07860 [candidate division WS1 bacterium]|jgi:hypothetical protein|nr:hypothetical protein [candidate division WS1 bacterium]
MPVYSRVGVVLIVLIVAVMAGCSGSTSLQKQDKEPPGNTGTVVGRVIKADSPGEALPGSRVSTIDGKVSTFADAQGDFVLRGVPLGQADTALVGLRAEAVKNASYGAQNVFEVPVTKGGIGSAQVTEIVIAILPLALGQPQSLIIMPSTATVDVRGEVQFSAAVAGLEGEIQVQPTWYLTKPALGSINPTGLFTAAARGTGQVVAVIGGLSDTAQVTVTASRAPQITSVMVNPSSLAPQGGTVTVSAAINDGDGLRSPDGVWAQLIDPESRSSTHVMSLVEGSSLKDGTFRVEIAINPNLVRHSQEDAMRTLTYGIRVHAVDNTGASSVSSLKNVTVAGVDQPIPPPAL